MKKSISSIELSAIINELSFLSKGRLTQIYDKKINDNREILLQIHISDQAKQLIKIIPGKLLCLTKFKEVSLKPSSFALQLRKYVDNAYIKNITQQNSERIVIIELEKKEKYFLIIELFSKGNVILTDSDYNIIGLLEKQEWKDRIVEAGKRYIFPHPGLDWKKMNEDQLASILQKSDRKNLATSLAMELGLGGTYAEEVCKMASVDKNQLPTDVSTIQVQHLHQSLQKLAELIVHPQGYIYPEEITPFPLQDKVFLHHFPTYNEAVATLNPFVKTSPYQQKIKLLEKMVAEQQQAIQKQNTLIQLNTQKAELIYEKYMPLQKLLEIVKELRKTMDWKDVEQELKKEKRIMKVDLKNKKIVVNL